MSIIALGVSHQTASIGLREKLSFTQEDIPLALDAIQKEGLAEEAVMLSTCNRTELYLAQAENNKSIYQWISDYRQIPMEELKSRSYIYQNEQASRHLFRVATGLDSLALGEPQILGQIKDSYKASLKKNAIKQTLNRLFQEAFYVAKNIRNDTKLGENSVSIAYTAVKLSEQFFDHYENLTALVIGAGQTGKLATQNLKKKGVGKILIANRSLSKAQNIAIGVGGYAMPLSQLNQHIHEADIIISATSSENFTVTSEIVKATQKQRRFRMQVWLDLAIPRDIDPLISEIKNNYLFTIDDLQNIIDNNQSIRKQAAQAAEDLIDDYNRHFNEWLQLRQHHRLIKHVHDFAQSEKEKLTQQALKKISNGEDPRLVIEELTTRLTKKLTHQPSKLIREASEKGQNDLMDIINSVYHFD